MAMKPGRAAPRSRPGASEAPSGDSAADAGATIFPDLWQPLPWHRPVWRRLMAAQAADRLHHALLFTGAAGTGKEHFARALAARLLCLAPVTVLPDPSEGATAESPEPVAYSVACGTCAACTSYAAGAHSLFSHLAPPPDKKDIALDDIRGLLERVALSGGAAHPRVALIHPPERLNTAGVNALLKTVEEPPGRLHLLLPTARPGVLPATLRSRLQEHRLPAPGAVAADAWLQRHGIVLGEAQRASGGHAPLTLLAWHRAGRFARHDSWNETLSGLADHRLSPAAAAAQLTTREREENMALLDWLEADAHRAWRGAAALDQPPAGGAAAARRGGAALTEARQRLGTLNMAAQGVVETLLARRVAAGKPPPARN